MSTKQTFGKILEGNSQLGPYPVERLRRVDRPTTLITENVKRIDARENAFARAGRGDYGEAVQNEAPHTATKDPFSNALAYVRRCVATNESNPVFSKVAPIPDDPHVLSRHIKRLGYFLRADIMAVTRLPEYAVYSHDMQGNEIDLDYKYAIVIVLGKEQQTLQASSGSDWAGLSLSYDLYLRLAVISESIANYIRRLGYPASAEYTGKSPGSSRVLFAPLLLWSGIGEISRAGITLNPFLGMHFKAAAILTDMPLEVDKPVDFGLRDFCEKCMICADFCPGRAIPRGSKTMHNGYETWKLDEQKCHSYRIMNRKGTYCGKCIKVCPWSQPVTWPHNMVRSAVSHSGIARSLAIRASKALGPDRINPDEKWWFDLDEADGEISIPKL